MEPAFAQVGATTLPTGPRVNAGQASVTTAGNSMTVNQTTPKVSLGWQSFSIGSRASVVFAQPSSSSVALNRVLGNDPSWIFGQLSANGHVYLINPAGVVFAPGARLNVGSIVASTLNMSDQDFMAGRYVFSGDSTASVVNRGSIITSPGGYAALFGANVSNEGTIVAPSGTVAMAAGSRVVMDLAGDGLLSVSVDAASARAMASNTGLIQADGGRVIVSARAADALAGTVLNQSGIIEARTASMRNGEIVLDGGSNGIVAVSGKLDASGTQAGATGGKITVTGNLVGLYGAELNVSGDAGGGTILVGGDYQGKNPEVRNAFRTYVDADSRLIADAVTTGNGGKVIVWADDATAFYGSITARGGAQGGDGGFAEVSGKQSLLYAGFTDLRAPLGKTGTLLLDPENVVIDSSGTDSVADASAFLTAFGAGDGSGTVTITPTVLETALNGANVLLQANSDITVADSVDASGGAAGNLTLEAGKSILIGASVLLNGSFTATANTANGSVVEAFRAAGSGAFTMTDGTSIDTSAGNGNIVISVQTGDPAGVNFDSGSITLSNLAAGAGGDVHINQGGQTAGSHILRTTSSLITADTVALEITNALNTTGTIGSSITGPIRVTTNRLEASSKNGAIFLESAGPVIIGGAALGTTVGINAGTGNVTLTGDETIGQIETITGNTLTVKTLKVGGAAITLNLAGNEFTSVDLRARNAADNANDAGAISYRDATGFDVAAAHTTSTVTLTGGNAITDTGFLTGTALTVSTRNAVGAAITLDNPLNEFTSVNLQALDAAGGNTNTVGPITYVDATAFSAAALTPGTVSMTATLGNLTVGAADIVTRSGAVTLTALEADRTIISAAGSNIDTTFAGAFPGAAVTLQSDRITLGGSITAGSGLVTLRPNADSIAIRVGATATDAVGVLGITNTELDQITTTGGVTIGSTTNTGGITVVGVADQATGATITGGTFTLRTNSGNIAVNAALSNAVATTLETTSGNISFGAAGSVTAAGQTVNLTATGGNIQGDAAPLTNVTAATLNASASSGIGSTNAIETAVSTLTFSNASNAVQVTDSLGTGVTVSGTNAGAGAVNITETLGDLTVGAGGILTNSGAVTLTNQAAAESIVSAGAISTTGGATAGAAVTLIANNMDLAGGTIASGSATTTLRQFTNGVLIAVGGADVASTTLGLTDAEIDTITAGKITIGNVNSGAMTITGAAAISPAGTNLLSLESGATITQTTNTAPVVVTNLALRAGTGIDLTANNSVVDGEGNTVTNLAAITSGAGNISFRNNASMTVGTVDGVNGISTNSGNITVTVAGATGSATDLFVDRIAAGGAGTVTLVATNTGAGAANIFEAPLLGTGDSTDDITTTGALSLDAKSQIGEPTGTNAGPIEIAVGSLAWSSGGTAYLSQTGDVSLTTMTTQGDVDFTAAGTISVDGDLNVNGNTTLTSTGDGEDIIVNANITRNNDSAGFVTLKAQRHVIVQNGADVTAQNVTLGGDGKTIITFNSDSNALNGGAILVDTLSTIASNNGAVIFGGGGNPLTAAAIGTNFNASTLFNGIDLRGSIVAGTGNVNLLGQSFFGGGTPNVSGVTINSGGTVTTTTGNITINGTGDRGAGNTQGVLITGPGTAITTTSGVVAVTGLHVSPVTLDSNVGVLVSNGASISSTDTAGTAGAVTLAGTGGAGTGNADHGVVLNGATVSVSGANLNLVGTGGGGGAAGGANSVGVQIANASIVETTGTGKVTLTGTGGATDGGLNYGIEITDLNTKLRATDTGSTALRIDLVGVGGAGGATGADNYGILVQNDAQVTANNSNIAFNGTGGASGGGANFGIAVLSGGVVESLRTVAGAGSIAFTGTGGAGTGNDDTGIVISGTNSRVTTHFGNMTFTGTGGADTTGASNHGILVASDAAVETDGQGQITLDGTGSATANGGNNFGVFIDSSGVVRNTQSGNLTGTAGKITIIGLGGLGTGAGDGGIGLQGGGTVSTINAEIELAGTGGAGTVGGQSYGVYSNGGIVSTSGDGNILITGVGGAAAGGSNHGIFTEGSAQIKSLAANAVNPAGTITLSGTAGVGGNDDIGINITGSTTVSSLDGKIDFFGTGTGTGTGSHGVRLATDASISSTGLAVIEIDGLGATQGTGNAIGIVLDTGAAITSTGTSIITLTGTGGGSAGSGNDNYGILVTGTSAADTKITSVTGNILLTGTGGGQTASTGNIGVVISGEADIATTGAAKVDLVGLSGVTGGTNNYGVLIRSADTTVSSSGTATSDITITGTGRGTGTNAFGVLIDSSAQVLTTGAGDIAITGTGATAGTGSAVGIQMATSASVVSNTGTGKITLTGTGGSTAVSGNDNNGISILTDSQITSVTGDILLTGTGGGAGAATSNYGVHISSGSDVATTGAAKIDIIGLSGQTSGTNNLGVRINGVGTTVSSSGTATSDISISGTGRGTGTNAFGVLMDSSSAVTTTGAGDIAITGTGAAAGTGSALGIWLDTSSSVVSNTGAGKITLTGTGGGTTGSGDTNYGLQLSNSSQVSSVAGDIRLDGTGGGTGLSTTNIGVLVQTGSDVITTGAAKIDIIGQSGVTGGTNNYGVQLTGAGTTVQSTSTATATGDINITGTGRGTGTNAFGVLMDGTAQVLTQGAGDVTITGLGATAGTGIADGIKVDNASVVSNTGAGKLTLTGTGGGTTGSGSNNYGVLLLSNSQVTSVTGDILLTGTGGGAGVAPANIGVSIESGSDVITTGAAKIDIVGQSGITGGANNYGVQLTGAGSTVQSTATATATGDINITGTGRGTGTNAIGVVQDLGAQVLTQGAGDVTITGTGSANGTGVAVGIQMGNTNTAVSSTGTGNLTLIGTGGGTTGSGSFNYGVNLFSDAQVTTVTGNISVTGTGGGTGAATDNYGVVMAGGPDIITSGAGKIDIIGQSGVTSGANNFGVYMVQAGTTVQSTATATATGDINIQGTGRGTGAIAFGVLIDNSALVLTQGAGDVTITGTGATAGTGSADGIQIANAAAVVSNTGAGKLTLTGTGGGTAGSGSDNIGIAVLANAQITSVTGDVLLTGTGGGTGVLSNSNIGVLIQSGSDVITTGAAKVDIIGQSGLTSGDANYGVWISGANTTVSSNGTATSDITITGTGRGTGTNAFGVLVDNTAAVTTTGLGDIIINGNGSTTGTLGAFGIQVDNASIVSNTSTGKISLTGVGGGTSGSGNANYGVVLSTNTQVTSVTGDILLSGTGGGTGAAIGNFGVYMLTGADVMSTGAAKIDIVGLSGITSGANNYGVQVTGANTTVTSSGTATSDITITGTGRGTGTDAHGVLIESSALVRTTGAGDVAITGTGSTTGTGNAVGIQVDNASIVSNTSTGTITLTGTGGGTAGSGDNNYGINLLNTAQVTSVTGNIQFGGTGGGAGAANGNVGVHVASNSDVASTGAATIAMTGTGGNTSGTGDHGVQVTGAGTTVTSTSTAVALTGTGGGTGGDSVGVLVDSGALVGTSTGSVTLTGTGAGAGANNFGVSLVAGGTVQATSSGSLALIGTGGAGAADISAAGGGNTIGNGGMTGEILLRSLGSAGTVSDANILTSGGSGIVTLNAQGGGGFNQTGGSVVSDSLRFLGSGTFSLPDPGGANAVNKIAGTLAATSAVTYVQNGAVQVASLTSFQDGVGINQTTSNGFDIAGAGSSLSVTSNGITQTAPIVVPGTTTLTDGGSNIVLNDPNNLFGTVNVVSANNVTLGGTSIGLGNVTPSGDLTINAGTLTDSGTVIIPGTATFNVTGNMVLDSPASDFSDVTFNVGGDATLFDVNELVVNTSTVVGLLTLNTGGALNTAPGDTITAGAVTATVASGGIGTLANNFSLDTDGDITLSVQGPAGSSPADGFVFNVGSGLLVLLPPTLLVRFNMVEFQPPTPATAALFTSANYAEQPQLDEITDLVFITDDPAEQLYPGVRRRIGRLPYGADINRDGAIRMPPGLAPSSQESGQGSEGDAPRSGRILLRE